MISAKAVADSKNEFGNRITSMEVTFPRIILAEFNTHRMFSRNSASSRAIPFEKMIKSVRDNPFIPIAWQKDHKGMQGTEYITDPLHIEECVNEWLKARDNAIETVLKLTATHHNFGKVTKQICNRLLESFMYHTVLVTATEWENFFALRSPKYEVGRVDEFKAMSFDLTKDQGIAANGNGNIEWKSWRSKKQAAEEWNLLETTEDFWRGANKGQAEIHMMALAEAMWNAYNESTPKELKAGQWHIPFGDHFDKDQLHESFNPSNPDELETMNEEWSNMKIKIATARCARVSYTVVGEEDKKDNYENDIKLHDKLAISGHWSPFEHCARTMSESDRSNWRQYYIDDKGNRRTEYGVCGNFRGFVQYRKMFDNENIN